MKKVKIEQAENGFVIFLLDGSYSERPVKTWVAISPSDMAEMAKFVFAMDGKDEKSV